MIIYEKAIIDSLKDDLKKIGFEKVTYRNRNGKQYMTVTDDNLELGDWNKITTRLNIVFNQHDIVYHTTSGSYNSRVIRINQDG